MPVDNISIMYSAWGVPAQTRARVRWWCGPRHGLAYTQPSACDPFSLQPELSKRNNFPLKYGCVLSERSTTGRTMWKMWPFSELFGLNSPLKLPAPQLRLSRAILSCKDFLKGFKTWSRLAAACQRRSWSGFRGLFGIFDQLRWSWCVYSGAPGIKANGWKERNEKREVEENCSKESGNAAENV